MNLSLISRIDSLKNIISQSEFRNSDGALLDIEDSINSLSLKFAELKSVMGNLYIVGNGGSAAIASHAVTDFFNVGGLKAFTLHDGPILTCMTNDYGYEFAFARQLKQVLSSKDILIAISSSGNSLNILNAALASKERGAFLITLSGFAFNNKLRGLGDINIWLNSSDYGFVEIGHQFILHNLADRLNINLKN